MQVKRKRLWCLVVAIMFWISGIYVQGNEVDFSFACTTTDEPISYISTNDTTITDIQACTAQTLDVYGRIEIRQLTMRLAKQKSVINYSRDFLCQSFFSLKEKNSYVTFEGINLLKDTQSILVTKYIHKSDGKKRV